MFDVTQRQVFRTGGEVPLVEVGGQPVGAVVHERVALAMSTQFISALLATLGDAMNSKVFRLGGAFLTGAVLCGLCSAMGWLSAERAATYAGVLVMIGGTLWVGGNRSRAS